MKQIPKFLGSLLHQPLLLSQDEQIRFKSFVNKVLDFEVEVDENLLLEGYEPSSIEELEYNPKTGIGVINVTGMLVDKYDPFLKYYYGATSYEELTTDVKTMLDAGAHTIIQYNNSGGGQAYNLFNTANSIRSMLDEKEAVMITYSDGITASAAFGLAAVSDEIVANPDSSVGSVGVVVSLLDTSKYMEKEGFKQIFITAGKGKVPFDKETGEYAKDFLAEIQAGVDKTYNKFTSHISANRPITQEQLVEIGAKVFDADEALDVGYVDKTMTREEFSDYFEDALEQKGNGNKMFFLDKFTKTPKKETQSMSHDNPIAEEKLAEVRSAIEAEYAPKLSELEASLTQAKAEFEAKISERDAEVVALKASLASFEKEKADKAAEAESAKQATRLSQLKEVFGDVEGEKLSTAYAKLPDEVFEATLSVVSGKAKAAAESLEEEDGDAGEELVIKPKTKEAAMAEHLAEKYGDKPTSPFKR